MAQTPVADPQADPDDVTKPPTVERQPSVSAESLTLDETTRLVEVALVVVPFVTVRDAIVEEELMNIPLVVVGAKYPLP